MLDRDDLFSAYTLPDRASTRVRMNFVTSIDGAATIDGRSGGLGDEDDQAIMGVLRVLADVLVVGAGTVRAEGYGGVRVSDADAARRRDEGMAEQPAVAVVSRALDLDPAHPFFADAVTRPIIITRAASPADRREALGVVADVLVCGEDSVDLRVALAALAERGLTQVLCEGGPHLFGSLVEADVVDEVCLSLSAMLVGGGAGRILRGASEAVRPMRLVHVIPTDDMLFLRYARR